MAFPQNVFMQLKFDGFYHNHRLQSGLMPMALASVMWMDPKFIRGSGSHMEALSRRGTSLECSSACPRGAVPLRFGTRRSVLSCLVWPKDVLLNSLWFLTYRWYDGKVLCIMKMSLRQRPRWAESCHVDLSSRMLVGLISKTCFLLQQVALGSSVQFFINGIAYGPAFTDILEGTYYPCASIYTMPEQTEGATVKANFGPIFAHPPLNAGGEPMAKPMSAVPQLEADLTSQAAAATAAAAVKDGNNNQPGAATTAA